MKHLIYLILLLAGSIYGQSIDYTLGLLDIDQRPVYHRSLKQTYSAPDGIYLQYGFGLSNQESTVSYFDGQTYKEIYTSGQPVRIVGATENGAFALESVEGDLIGRNLLFLPRSGVADTLSSSPLTSVETYQLGPIIYIFSSQTGVKTYTERGKQTVIRSNYNDCVCNDSERYLRLGDRLIYNNQNEYYITDGTAAGTERIFGSSGELFVLKGKVIHGSTLQLYDPAARTTTDLLAPLGSPANLLQNASAVSVTPNGLVFTARFENTGQALYVTDGTVAGTRVLKETGSANAYGGYASAVSVADLVLFREGGTDAKNRSYWLTDGSVLGTYKVLEVPKDQIGEGIGVSGYAVSSTRLILTYFSSVTGESYVFSVDTEAEQQLATPVAKVPFDLYASAPRIVDGRLLVGANYRTDSLYSFGTTPGDLQVSGVLDVFADFVYASSDAVYYLKGGQGGNQLYASRGLNGDLLPILPVVTNASDLSSYAAVFAIEKKTFAHTFDPVYGEAIFYIDDKFATRLVVDLYPNTAGIGIRGIYGLGDHVFWTTDAVNRLTTHLSDGTVAGTRIIVEDAGIPDKNLAMVGSVGSRYYFADDYARQGVYEFNASTAVMRKLTDVFEQSISNPLFLDGLIYTVINVESSPLRQIRRLISFEPLSGQITTVRQDTTPGEKTRGIQSIATDGKFVYYTTSQNGGIGPTSYDPITGRITPLGKIDLQAKLNFRQVGDRVLVDYNRLPYGKTARLVGPTTLGPVFDLDTPDYVDGVSLTSGFITRGADGILYNVDYGSGRSTPLTAMPDEPGINILLTQTGPSEAIFFVLGIDSSAIWRTDGSVVGTRILTTPETRIKGLPITVKPFGELFAIITPTVLYLLDIRDGELQLVPAELDSAWPQPPLAVVGDRLYFAAVDPVFGQELHYLTAKRVINPTSNDLATSPIALSVYPNPTSDMVWIDNPAGLQLSGFLYNGSGRLLKQLPLSHYHAISLNEFPAGIYFLRLYSPQAKLNSVQRIVKH